MPIPFSFTRQADGETIFAGDINELQIALEELSQSSLRRMSVNKGGVDQTGLVNLSFNKLTFSTKVEDTHTTFSTGTSRWTPGKVGQYLVTAAVQGDGSSGATYLSLYKNGVRYLDNTESINSTSYNVGMLFAAVIQVTAITDYFEFYFYPTGSTTITGDIIRTWWQAFEVPTAVLNEGASSLAYFHRLSALLEPDALEQLQYNTFTYTVGSSETKYLMASWQTRLGSAGRMEVRDPRQALPLRGVTLTGTGAGSSGVFLNPTIPTYTDARDKYYSRLEALHTLPTRYLPLTGSQTVPMLPGPYGAILLRAVAFDATWIVLRSHGGIGYNLANEESDTAIQREDNALMLPLHKKMCCEAAINLGGSGSLVYVLVPSTWSVVPDTTTYLFRDDFMGTPLNTAATWNRTQSTAGNMEIDTLYQWLKVVGDSTWGTNTIFSQASVARASGRVFQADIYISRTGDINNGYAMLGFHDGAGTSYTDLAHGINFGGSSGTLSVFENGTSRGTVGSGYTQGNVYRVRITLGASNTATYQIQGGTQYPALGGTTWTNITPATSSSSTTPLHAGIVAFAGTSYVSDVRIW